MKVQKDVTLIVNHFAKDKQASACTLQEAMLRPQNKQACILICRAGNMYPQIQVLCVISADELFAGVDPPHLSSRVPDKKQMTHTAIASLFLLCCLIKTAVASRKVVLK